MQLTVFLTACPACDRVFYEFENAELDECPYCGAGTKGANIERSEIVEFAIDHKTGLISLDGLKTTVISPSGQAAGMVADIV